MIITYRERRYIDKYTVIDTIAKVECEYAWTIGGLLYCRINRFAVKTIALEDIVSIRE